jgi:class 3 adenylate cyclase
MTCPKCGTLNPAGMRYCGMCGRSLDGGVGGRERRRVSTVFVDLAAFSDLTRDQDPEELRDLADEVLTVVAGVVEDYDGYVDAFRGDGLIALFGAPHSHPDDAERAVRAAAASLRAIEGVGAGRGIALRGRAGVNTGVVIAGAIGSGRVRDYTVMGSAVNLAARLEAAAEPGTVWVGPDTFREVRHRLAFEKTEEVALAGFPDVRHAYRLIRSDEVRPADPYAQLAFVGREREVAELRAARDAVARRGRAREVWLVGETGSGKSRLLREAFADGGRDVVWLRVPVGGEPPWPQLAETVFGVDEVAQSPAVRQRLEAELAALLPDEPRWWRAVLASLHLVEERPWRRLDRRSNDRTALAWRDLLAAKARAGSCALTIVLDDDPRNPELDELLALLAVADAPILIVRAGRARHVPADADRIQVAPLSAEASLALVRELVDPTLEPAWRSLVPQLGGVPAHLIELGRALSEHEDGAVSLSLAGLLQARLDRVEGAARSLLAHASLTGERVWDGLLRDLAPGRRGRLIEVLVQDKLLVPEPGSSLPGQREYRFQSELLRRAVMRMVPFRERPPVHVRIASWMEAHAPLALSETIAEHFEQGEAPEAAYAHLMAAAEHHQQLGDPERSYDLYRHASELPVSPELRAQAALAWAQLALDRQAGEVAAHVLTRAEHAMAACDEETCARLREVAERLRRELGAPASAPARASASAAPDDAGAEPPYDDASAAGPSTGGRGDLPN